MFLYKEIMLKSDGLTHRLKAVAHILYEWFMNCYEPMAASNIRPIIPILDLYTDE